MLTTNLEEQKMKEDESDTKMLDFYIRHLEYNSHITANGFFTVNRS